MTIGNVSYNKCNIIYTYQDVLSLCQEDSLKFYLACLDDSFYCNCILDVTEKINGLFWKG
jgi:hypothetical protein